MDTRLETVARKIMVTTGETMVTIREAEDSVEEAEDSERNSTANVIRVESMDIELPNAEATRHRRPWEKSHS